jgi:hypothetical protein
MKKLATRTTQRLQVAEFVFNFNDWAVDAVDGAKKTFGSTPALTADPLESGLTGTVGATLTFDAIPLPVGAVMVGGAVIVETAGVGPTAYTITVGTAASATAYLASTSLLAAGRTALLLTSPLASNAGQNVRIAVNSTVANATAGKVRIRLDYTIDGKADEISIA